MIGLGLSITQLAVRQLVGQFNPMKLFALGEQGAWYDPSDIKLDWRYNLLTRTEEFDDAAWTKNAATIAANTVVAPDGTLTGDALVEDSTTASRYVFNNQSVVSGTTYTGSVYVKQGGRTWLQLTFSTGTFGASQYANFDISTGVLGTVVGGTATITSVGNGWYRCTFTVACTTSGSASCLPVIGTSGTTGRLPTYTGDGTSGIYIWGASLTTAANADKPYQKITDGVSDYFTYQPQPVLFQDSSGTTPVTAVEQPVGLMLDKSQGLVLGPELVTNGTFETNITGWVVGNAGQSTLAWADGKLRITRVNAGDTYPNARTTLTGLTVGRIYKIVSATNNPFGIEAYHAIQGIALSTVRTTLAAKTMECVFTATATSHNLDVGIWGSSGSVGQYVEFDNISVRELPGNHAFQTTATSRPVLSARYNLLTKTEEPASSPWMSTTGGVTVSGKVITFTGVGTQTWLQTVTTPAPVGASVVSTFVLSGSGTLRIGVARFGTGSYEEAALIVTLTSTPTSYSVPLTIANSGQTGFIPFIAINTELTARVVTLDSAALVYANQADLPYQRVNTATDYDAGPAFPRYLRCDGIDDGMVTGTITPGTDKAQVFAGVRKLSDTAAGIVAELSSSILANSGSFFLEVNGAGAGVLRFISKGTVLAQAFSGSTPTPSTELLTGLGDISGDIATLRVNGTQSAQSTVDQGTGNYGNYPLYLFRRGGISLPFNGNVYQLVIRFGDNLPIETIEQTETWMAAKTGVTL